MMMTVVAFRTAPQSKRGIAFMRGCIRNGIHLLQPWAELPCQVLDTPTSCGTLGVVGRDNTCEELHMPFGDHGLLAHGYPRTASIPFPSGFLYTQSSICRARLAAAAAALVQYSPTYSRTQSRHRHAWCLSRKE